MRNGPSTEASLKAAEYCPKDSTSIQRHTSFTDQEVAFSGSGFALMSVTSLAALKRAGGIRGMGRGRRE